MDFQRLTEKQLKEAPEEQLRQFKPAKKFLVAIDTDGCVTDNMSGKQMLIFHPQYLEFYQLWEIESYVREIMEYYNLFSVSRGCNRFIAVQSSMKALWARADVRKAAAEKNVQLPPRKPVDEYVAWCTQNKVGLGNPSLGKFLAARPMDLEVYKLLGWSEAVNRMFPYIQIPPFDNVKESLALMAESADILVVSQTPYDDLANFWEANGLTRYIRLIAGQEMGTKAHHIELAKKAGGYADQRVLMLGDADGDLKAVQKNNGLFYPVPPGHEQEAWHKLPERFAGFISGTYAGELADQLLDDFSKILLSVPPWEQPGYDHVKAYREKQEARKGLYQQLNPGGKLLIL